MRKAATRISSGAAALRYFGPFLILASIPLLHRINPLAPFATIAFILFVILLGEQFSPDWARYSGAVNPKISRLLPIFYIPAQLAVILWAAHTASTSHRAGGEFAALVLSVGATMGIFGVLAAHEMAHSRKGSEQMLGALLLTGMGYRHFRIAHVHGHHRFAGTDDDASTARRGENFYAFLIRTLIGQWKFAWDFEQRRCRNRQTGLLFNRCLQDLAIFIVVVAAIAFVWGRVGVTFFFAQSLVAIFVLELFNYVAHYGLLRRRDSEGMHEPFSDRHAWNSSGALANIVIFNMGRHSDHHRRAAAPYETLQPATHAPELPSGYVGSIFLALIPPLWRHVMDKRLDLLERSRSEEFMQVA